MFKRILVPVDGSSTSGRALATAVKLAHDHGGQLRVIHVPEVPYSLGGYEGFSPYSDELFKAIGANAERVAAEGAAIALAAGVPAQAYVPDDFFAQLGDSVARAASQWHADLVVLGTHGRRGIGRVLLGSGAEQIIRQASVPVLVVRADETQPAS